MVKCFIENGKFFINDCDNITELEVVVLDKKANKWKLKLPENSANRQWLDRDSLIEKGEIILEYKATRVISSVSSGKKLLDYLTPEEKTVYDELMLRCQERKDADKKQPLSEENRIKSKIEKLKAQLKSMGVEA